MDTESLAETGRKLNVAILKCQDEKGFRVRTLSDIREIYARYFNYKAADRISKIQIALAVIVATSQVITMCVLRYKTSLEYLGLGNWTSIVTIFAAACVLWTCKNTSYLRLHLSMALHIVAVLVSMLFLLIAFEDAIPQLKMRLYSNYLTPHAGEIRSYNSVYQLDYDSATTARPVKYYSREHGPMSIIALSLTLAALMSITTMVQMALSVIMAVMTARTMCIGRIKMEGKLFAMEVAGKEEKDTFMVIPCKSNVSTEVPAPRISEPRIDTPPAATVAPPPSYNKVLLGHIDTDSAA